MKKKRIVIAMLVVTMVLSMVLGTAWAIKTEGGEKLTGKHYNLNIIGMTKDKNVPEGDTPGQGHRIFVRMSKTGRLTTKIMLQEGEPYAVIDYDGTDGTAEFQLPNPDPDNTGTTGYSVYLRLRGNPGGEIKMTTCATDPLTEEELCSDLQVIEVRETGHGKNKFRNVSSELLYIYALVCTEVDPDTGDCIDWEYMRVPLFADELEGYFWDYDNKGCRLAQLRFYEISTTVLKNIEPKCGNRGDENLTVTITADDYYDLDEATVDFGKGISIDSVVIDNGIAKTITAVIDIANNATEGSRNVTVTLDDVDQTKMIISFRVNCAL